MTKREVKVLGLITIFLGVAMLAPKETDMFLTAMSNQNTQLKEKSEKALSQSCCDVSSQEKPKEQIGLIRKNKRAFVNAVHKFWRWLY